jgi:hypothetical protein
MVALGAFAVMLTPATSEQGLSYCDRYTVHNPTAYDPYVDVCTPET